MRGNYNDYDNNNDYRTNILKMVNITTKTSYYNNINNSNELQETTMTMTTNTITEVTFQTC